jgi:hypothetical protein
MNAGWLALLPLLAQATVATPPVPPPAEEKAPKAENAAEEFYKKHPFKYMDDVAASPEDEATVVARQYVDAMTSGRSEQLAALGSDPFSFDGRVVKGRAAIAGRWSEILTRQGEELNGMEPTGIRVIAHDAMLKEFGPPPQKFSKLPLKRALYAVVTFEARPGFVLILDRLPKAVWQVIAVVD